eukprot:7604471-Pyramimonas_sp.AAC.1
MALSVLGAGSGILYARLIDERGAPGQTRQVRAGDPRHIFAKKWLPLDGAPKGHAPRPGSGPRVWATTASP